MSAAGLGGADWLLCADPDASGRGNVAAMALQAPLPRREELKSSLVVADTNATSFLISRELRKRTVQHNVSDTAVIESDNYYYSRGVSPTSSECVRAHFGI